MKRHRKSRMRSKRNGKWSRKSLTWIIGLTIITLCYLGMRGLRKGPIVISSNPSNNSIAVSPQKRFISVTFNRPMRNNSCSLGRESPDTFPQVTGNPFFSADRKTCMIPVALEPDKSYVILINPDDKHKNFKDENGTPAVPYKLTFSTNK